MKKNKNKWKRVMYIVLGLLITPLALLWYFLTQPTFASNQKSSKQVDSDKLKQHVITLSQKFHPRNDMSIDNLNACADYIAEHLRKAGGKVSFQEYEMVQRTYKNVVAIFGPESKERIVIGAHYDTCGDTPGADDNASGVAGLIELAYLLQKYPLDKTVELVAFTLEEPPSFATKWMGSYIHAKKAHEDKIKIPLMVSLEMIGYFTDEQKQEYPLPALKLYYPKEGNFIAVVSHLGHASVTKNFKAAMKGATDLPVYSINAPRSLTGIDFSDHRNYWEYDVPALMVTDTAFYRNKEYHKPGDTADRLDYSKMANVVIGVYEAISDFTK